MEIAAQLGQRSRGGQRRRSLAGDDAVSDNKAGVAQPGRGGRPGRPRASRTAFPTTNPARTRRQRRAHGSMAATAAGSARERNQTGDRLGCRAQTRTQDDPQRRRPGDQDRSRRVAGDGSAVKHSTHQSCGHCLHPGRPRQRQPAGAPYALCLGQDALVGVTTLAPSGTATLRDPEVKESFLAGRQARETGGGAREPHAIGHASPTSPSARTRRGSPQAASVGRQTNGWTRAPRATAATVASSTRSQRLDHSTSRPATSSSVMSRTRDRPASPQGGCRPTPGKAPKFAQSGACPRSASSPP